MAFWPRLDPSTIDAHMVLTAAAVPTPGHSPVLRDYQTRALSEIAGHFRRGEKSVLAVAPTGAGKGTMAVALLHQIEQMGRRGLFLVHRREIVHDICDRLLAAGVHAGVVMNGQAPRRELPIQVASIQTIVGESPRPYDLVIADEAHHYASDEWGEFVRRLQPRALCGFTATPQRSDGRPLGDMFEVLVDVVSYSELLARGHLVPARLFRPECPLDRVDTLAKDPVEAYLAHAAGRRALFFVEDLAAARKVRDRLHERGIEAATVTATTPYEERKRAVQSLRTGSLQAIVNFYTMAEGVDIPSVSAIVLARNAAYDATYLQMIGRALRPHPGKEDAIILDLTGTSFQHGLPLEDRIYALRQRKEDESGRKTREHYRRAQVAPPQSVLGVQLVEATIEQQMVFGRRRISWGNIGLGKRADRVIAEQLGVSTDTVNQMRRKLGIAPYRKGHDVDWDAVGLGQRTDSAIAQELGIPKGTIATARRARGIEPFVRGRGVRLDIDWDAVGLGQRADKVLARELGVASSTVLLERKRRGIPPFGLGAPLAMWDGLPLGQKPDAEIAREYGLSVDAVRNARKRRKIHKYDRQDLSTGPGTRSERIDWSKVPLGQKSDIEIAKALRVPMTVVRSKRRSLGIKGKRGPKPRFAGLVQDVQNRGQQGDQQKRPDDDAG